jgi:dipeptidyl aminopeptidase/acylaminoacyl peptidase
MSPSAAPYGSWKSPITSELIASAEIGMEMTAWDGDVQYWIENRPWEAGRSVVVRRTPDGQVMDVTPPAYNARSRVHEYGGGAMTVEAGKIYFSNFSDQRLYKVIAGAASDPQPFTPEGAWRYADGIIDSRRKRLICVREDHTALTPIPSHTSGREENAPSNQAVINTIVSMPLEAAETPDQIRVLVSGNDFFASPRLSPDGKYLAWLAWNHPNMPWDGTELWVGELAEEGMMNVMSVAGGLEESIYQPEWSPDGVLYFVSDRSGWWNLYRWKRETWQVEPVLEMAAEFGRPQWVFGRPTYGFAHRAQGDCIICSYNQNGTWRMGSIDLKNNQFTPLDCPYTDIRELCISPDGQKALLIAGSAFEAVSIVQLNVALGQFEVLRGSIQETVDPGYLSAPQTIEFPSGPVGERDQPTAHAFFYPPCNRDYSGPISAVEKPPLLVFIHGGPTSATTTSLNLTIQYWTSRGIAVLDVNYRGSTGYGRAYRQLLNGQWGIADMDDCVNGALYLTERGLVNRDRLAIRGGSAGGYTTLCALTFRNVFKAGASYFGIGDLEIFVKDTHKFEARYIDSLVGPYPQALAIYWERSPIHAIQRLSYPVIFFQGLEDRIVPPNQAEMMVDQLRKKGLPVAYLSYEGEGHGFRRAENIKRSLDAELYFYAKIFGFEIADVVEPVKIENL